MTNYNSQHWYSSLNPMRYIPLPDKIKYGGLALAVAGLAAFTFAYAMPKNTESLESLSSSNIISVTATPQPSALEQKVRDIATPIPPTKVSGSNYDPAATLALWKTINAAGASATPEQIGEWMKIALELGYNSTLEYKNGDYKIGIKMGKDAEYLIKAVLWDIALSDWDVDKELSLTIAYVGWQGSEMTPKRIEELRKYAEEVHDINIHTRYSKSDKVEMDFSGLDQCCLGKAPKKR